jgi:outer membrane lipoprotein-sorting protein
MMGRMIRHTSITLFLSIGFATFCAQAQPDVVEILKNVSATYNVSQYEFDMEASVSGGGKPAVSHANFSFKAPNKYRMQGRLPGMDLPGGGEMLLVSDGSTIWFYLPNPNQYGSISLSEVTPDAPGDLGDLAPEAMNHFMTWRYRGAADFADGAKFLREETLEVAGGKIPCFVLTIKPPDGALIYTWWIDKTRFRILREDDAGNSTLFATIRLGESIPDERFKFTPPPGARKLELDK